METALRILHLSDLHIPPAYLKDSDFKTIKLNLIKDIEKQKKQYRKFDVLVVSGDFVDKGNVKLFKDEVIKFINDILQAAEIPKNNIIFTPGNHDAERPTGMVLDQIKKVRENCEITDNDDDVGFMCRRFAPFLEFYNSFGESSVSFAKSYGVRDISLDCGTVYRFICLNSSLATYDNSDYNNLFMTKVQLDDILCQLNDEVEPCMTFLVMHHPLDWLVYEERKLLEEYITDENKFNVDIIMNGHIHSGFVSLKSDLDTNIINLVSGIGYGKIDRKKSVYPDKYRYAIYEINPEANSLNGFLRITNEKRTFGPDTTLYKKINSDGKFRIPLKMDYELLIHQIKLPLSTQRVLNEQFMKGLDDNIENLHKYEQQVKNSVDDIARKRVKDSKNKISVFFFNLCIMFRTIFFPYVNNEAIRIHVRYFFPDENAHKVIMSLYGNKKHSGPVTAIKWKKGSNLIYYSYTERRTLIDSLNRDKAFHNPNSRWDDFLTLAISYSNYSRKDVPALSFGVSFDWDDMETDAVNKVTNTLYILSYMGLEHVMENIIEYASNRLKFKNFDFAQLGGNYEHASKSTSES